MLVGTVVVGRTIVRTPVGTTPNVFFLSVSLVSVAEERQTDLGTIFRRSLSWLELSTSDCFSQKRRLPVDNFVRVGSESQRIRVQVDEK